MPDYRRYRLTGGTYFFTVNLLQRYLNDLLVRNIDILRTVVRAVREKRPFVIDAHIDYCHINPFKHGYVRRVADWPYSTFQRDVERGILYAVTDADFLNT
jgi:hypothetical protein